MPHNHAVFRAFGTSFRPMPERKADGEEEPRRPTGARRTEAPSEKIFQNSSLPPSLHPPELSEADLCARLSPSRSRLSPLCFSFSAFLFLGLTFLFRSISSPLSLLLSISICAIGRAILVSSFTGGFRTRLSRHLRASHAASSDHPFSEKTLSSSLNELQHHTELSLDNAGSFDTFQHCISVFTACYRGTSSAC